MSDLKEYIETHSTIRYNEANLSHNIYELCDLRNCINDGSIKEFFIQVSEVKAKHHTLAIQNKDDIEKKLLFAIESHLLWIDSVIDLWTRWKEVSVRLDFLNEKLKDPNDKEAEHDFCNEQYQTKDKLPKMEKGLKYEFDLLVKGTKDFYENKLWDEAVNLQITYISKLSKLYSGVGDQTDLMDKSVIGGNTNVFKTRGMSFNDNTESNIEQPIEQNYETNNLFGVKKDTIDNEEAEEELDNFSD